MKRIFLLVFLMVGLTAVFGQKSKTGDGERTTKVTQSDIRWWGYKVVKSEATTHTGFVKLKSGKFYFKHRQLVGGEFVIDMRSLTNTDLSGEDQTKLTDDLKSSNFFEVKKFPVAKFVMTKVVPSNNAQYNSQIIGNITIKGIRKTISFPANIRIHNFMVDFESAKFSLNRQDFKAFYRSPLKDYIIKDQMDLQIKMSTN